MELARKPFQGVWNIIRFNWHFYVIAGVALMLLFYLSTRFDGITQVIIKDVMFLTSFTILVSLLASYHIYDYSDLYKFKWLQDIKGKSVLNINAGFDETSEFITTRFSPKKTTVVDFYDPEKHTEVSIIRARRAYPSLSETISVTTGMLPFEDGKFDSVIAILSLHEVRDEEERIVFLSEINRVTKNSGQVYITEHLRDLNNFLAYSLGFLHFHSKDSWMRTFEKAGLTVTREIKTTPFITTFIIEKNGDTS